MNNLLCCLVLSCSSLNADPLRPLWCDMCSDVSGMELQLLSIYSGVGIIEVLIDDMQRHPDRIESDLLLMRTQIENIRATATKSD